MRDRSISNPSLPAAAPGATCKADADKTVSGPFRPTSSVNPPFILRSSSVRPPLTYRDGLNIASGWPYRPHAWGPALGRSPRTHGRHAWPSPTPSVANRMRMAAPRMAGQDVVGPRVGTGQFRKIGCPLTGTKGTGRFSHRALRETAAALVAVKGTGQFRRGREGDRSIFDPPAGSVMDRSICRYHRAPVPRSRWPVVGSAPWRPG